MQKEEYYMTSLIKSENNAIKNIGVIGIGTMGRCMIQKLIESGFKVSIYDISVEAKHFAKEKGLCISESPANLADISELIILSLPGPAQVKQVVFGKDGIINTVKKGIIVVDTSTVDPSTTRNIAEKLTEIDIEYLDCPVLGRPSAVGKWLLPAGGNSDTLERVKPVLLTFSSNVILVGKSGAGNAVKLLNQMMFTVINAISVEVMAIADYCGVSKEVFYNTVANSSAATVSGLFKEVGKSIIENGFSHPSFTIDLLVKDTNLALQMAKEVNAPSVIAGMIQIYNEIAIANNLGKEDTSALYKVFKRHFTDK